MNTQNATNPRAVDPAIVFTSCELSSVHNRVDTLDPSPQHAQGGAGSVGLADGCDPGAGYDVPMNARAHMYLRGRIPRDGAPAPRFGTSPLPQERGAS